MRLDSEATKVQCTRAIQSRASLCVLGRRIVAAAIVGAPRRFGSQGVSVVDENRISRLFDLWVLRVLRVTMALGITAALAILVLLVIRELGRSWTQIDSIAELQQAVQALFAGVLLVVLGLELMDTLRNYFIEHRLRVEFLISVALIAVARHVIQLDYEHESPWLVIAIAVLIFALAVSYVAIRKFDYGARRSPDRS
jgi:uncharacterized membrane protein (DUF373 family)